MGSLSKIAAHFEKIEKSCRSKEKRKLARKRQNGLAKLLLMKNSSILTPPITRTNGWSSFSTLLTSHLCAQRRSSPFPTQQNRSAKSTAKSSQLRAIRNLLILRG